jgi:hypothetical protein
MQMVLTPNDLFSWNNKYSEYRLYYYITLQWIHRQLCSYARWLTLCMLVSLSREGVVFFVFLPSSHFTEIHVLPPPVSEANWRSLSRPGVSPPPFLFKNGVFIHRVRTLSLPRVRHSRSNRPAPVRAWQYVYLYLECRALTALPENDLPYCAYRSRGKGGSCIVRKSAQP